MAEGDALATGSRAQTNFIILHCSEIRKSFVGPALIGDRR